MLSIGINCLISSSAQLLTPPCTTSLSYNYYLLSIHNIMWNFYHSDSENSFIRYLRHRFQGQFYIISNVLSCIKSDAAISASTSILKFSLLWHNFTQNCILGLKRRSGTFGVCFKYLKGYLRTFDALNVTMCGSILPAIISSKLAFRINIPW